LRDLNQFVPQQLWGAKEGRDRYWWKQWFFL